MTMAGQGSLANTRVVTISTDGHHTLQEFRFSVGAQWTFLSDPGRTIQKDLDIQEYTTGQRPHDPAYARTQARSGHSQRLQRLLVWGRPSVYDLWRELREASSENRPDWVSASQGCARPWRQVTTGVSRMEQAVQCSADRAVMMVMNTSAAA
jgi:phytoene dehydrogenase-like protein